MQLDLTQIKRLFRSKSFYTVLVIYVVIFALLGFAVYAGYSTYNLWIKIKAVNADIDAYKNTAELIQNNKRLVVNNIDDLNKTLEEIIPDTENYFSVVNALEQLAAQTGVDIISYEIDLESSDASTLSLNIQVEGNKDALESFYKQYQFAGGRLVTSDGLEFLDDETSTVTIAIKFYHDEYTDSGSGETLQISQSDIDFVKGIESQVKSSQ